MKLKFEIDNIRDIRKNSRVILEKMKDLSFPSKFESIIDKKNISSKLGKASDVNLCLNYIIESYNCFLSVQFDKPEHPTRKYHSLIKSLNILSERIDYSIKFRSPVKRKFVANVLRAHTKYFNSIELKLINNNCGGLHEKSILTAISVWNNQWS